MNDLEPDMTNPLLALEGLPDFAAIRAEHVEPAVTAIVERHRAALQALLALPAPCFASLIEPFEDANHALARVWSAVQHLNSVLDREGFREAFNRCRVLLADYHAEVGQNPELYRACERIREAEAASLSAPQLKLLDNLLGCISFFPMAWPAPRQHFKHGMARELARIVLPLPRNRAEYFCLPVEGWLSG